jgi:hypothetical protein
MVLKASAFVASAFLRMNEACEKPLKLLKTRKTIALIKTFTGLSPTINTKDFIRKFEP